jgi:hypothetical protein
VQDYDANTDLGTPPDRARGATAPRDAWVDRRALDAIVARLEGERDAAIAKLGRLERLATIVIGLDRARRLPGEWGVMPADWHHHWDRLMGKLAEAAGLDTGPDDAAPDAGDDTTTSTTTTAGEGDGPPACDQCGADAGGPCRRPIGYPCLRREGR